MATSGGGLPNSTDGQQQREGGICHPAPHFPPSLLSGEEMTVKTLFLPHFCGQPAVQSFDSPISMCACYLVARAVTNVAVLIKLLAMTPSPTQRAVPSAPR